MTSVLFCSPPSPYSLKTRMAAKHFGLDVDVRMVVTADEPAELLKANPLGKIPTLVIDNGEAVFDSVAIMQEFDRMSGKKIYPRSADKRRAAERLEAAGDGLCDALIAQIYEVRMRPADKVEQSWLDKQDKKAGRMLDWLNDNCVLRGKPHGGHFAVAAGIAYLELRFPNKNWQRGRPKLKRFMARFAEAVPAYDELRERA